MKFGIRKRSYKKSFKAMTTGRVKRSIKRQVIPFYGKKGSGWIKNPKKAAYNAVYSKTTIKSPLPYFSAAGGHGSAGQGHGGHSSPQVPVMAAPMETIATSSLALAVGSNNFAQLKHDLTNVYQQRSALKKQLGKANTKYILTFVFSSKEKKKANKDAVEKLQTAVENAYISLTFRDGMKDPGSWDETTHYFQQLMQTSDMVWDLTMRKDTDKYHERTIANESVDRKPVLAFLRKPKTLDFIKSDTDCMYLPNLNGADIYLYPTFIVLFKDYQTFSIHDLQAVALSATATSFHEDGRVPTDATIIGETYKYTNKNGTPDKRFQNNFVIPVAKYGDFRLRSETGINDRYMFSNFDVFAEFTKSLVRFAEANLRIRTEK